MQLWDHEDHVEFSFGSSGFQPDVLEGRAMGVRLCTSLISKLRRTLMVFSTRPPLMCGITSAPLCSDTTCCSAFSTFPEMTGQVVSASGWLHADRFQM